MTTIREYVEKNLGGRVDMDGYYGYQCVDLIKNFIKVVYSKETKGIGNAFENYKKLSNFGFESINYDGKNRPKRGDIISFKKEAGNGYYGHVGVCLGTNEEAKQVYILEQNGGRNSSTGTGSDAVRIQKIPFSKMLGWARYKNIFSKINEDLFDKIIFENNDYIDETKVKRRNAVKGIYFIFNGNFDGWEQVGISKNLDEAVIRRDFAYILRGYLKNVRGIDISYDDLINKYNVWSGARGGDFLTSFELNVMLKNMKKIFG